jgi:hypothetical protein
MKIKIALVILVFAFISCEQEVFFSFEHEPRLCLNAILNPDSIIKVRLTSSHSLENISNFNPVTDGNINIYEEDQLFGILVYNEDGNYVLNKKPVEGKLYTVTAEVKNYRAISGKTLIPVKPDIKYSKVVTGYVEYDSTLATYNLQVQINDRPGRDNYWITSNWVVHGVRYGGSVRTFNAPFLDGFNKTYDSEAKYGFTIFLGVRLSDEGYDGKPMEFVIPDYVENTARRYTEAVYFLNADEHYDKYIKTSIINRMKETSDVPFFEPVQIHSNIKNGYGIFGSCAITTIKL